MPDPRRRRIVRNAAGVGLATGAYGLSFGALSVAAGLSPVQTMVLSLVMFTGGSQFALVLVLGQGGTWPTAASSAAMLGSRNVFYGPRVAELLARPRGWRRLLTAQVTVDETVAMALGQKDDEDARLAFWATAAAIYPCGTSVRWPAPWAPRCYRIRRCSGSTPPPRPRFSRCSRRGCGAARRGWSAPPARRSPSRWSQ